VQAIASEKTSAARQNEAAQRLRIGTSRGKDVSKRITAETSD
jgi:hypothetical protein